MISIKIKEQRKYDKKEMETPVQQDKSIADLLFTKSEETTLAAQRYEIVRKIGEGSYAKVYLCKKIVDGKTILSACKTIDTKNGPRDYIKKFLPREIEILLKIKHQFIIHVDFIFQRRAKYFILMRYAENRDLLEYILSHQSVSEKRARYWMSQLYHALHYLHDEENIVHRDIKCENILLTEHFNVRVCDFGFSRKMSKKDDTSRTFCGSRAYTAPEVLRGKPYNPKKYDIWSSGVVLMVLINRKFPFNEPTNRKLIQKMLERKINYRPKVEEAISPELKDFISYVLDPEPKRRWTALQCLQSDWVNMDERIHQQMQVGDDTGGAYPAENIHKIVMKAQENADQERSAVTVLKPLDAKMLVSTYGPPMIDESLIVKSSTGGETGGGGGGGGTGQTGGAVGGGGQTGGAVGGPGQTGGGAVGGPGQTGGAAGGGGPGQTGAAASGTGTRASLAPDYDNLYEIKLAGGKSEEGNLSMKEIEL